MNRSLKIAVGIVIAAAVILTSHIDGWTKYHSDTLRSERHYAVHVLGLKIYQWRAQLTDNYTVSYFKITDREPDPNHWHTLNPDSIQSFFGTSYRCMGPDAKTLYRREILTSIFKRFQSGMPKEIAATYITRLDQLVPSIASAENVDSKSLDILRKDLGLKPHFPEKAQQDAAANP